MKISHKIVKREVDRFMAGEWRLVPLRIRHSSCHAISDPIPDGGPFKAIEVRRNPDGKFYLYIEKENNGRLMPGDRMSFSPSEVDYWLDIKPTPWCLEIE